VLAFVAVLAMVLSLFAWTFVTVMTVLADGADAAQGA